MKIPETAAILARIKKMRRRNRDRFLREISGVIHVGANTGQERHLYDAFGLHVLWIEPIPEVFEILQANIKAFPKQSAIQHLISDYDDKEYEFHIASNDGLSSSMLDFRQHKDIWPDVAFTSTVSLKSTTLTSLLRRDQIDPSEYQALIMDTQGSELLVLKGAIPVLSHFRFIKTEVADFESYAGGCRLADINSFMAEHGFKECFRRVFASRVDGGSYYDITYRK